MDTALKNVPRRGFPVFVGIFFLIFLFGVAAYVNLLKLQDATGAEEHTFAVVGQLDLILSTLKDAETGQRGYVLTGDPRYLEPYDAAVSVIDEQNARLRRLTSGHPESLGPLDRIASLSRAKLGELRESIDAAREHGQGAALAVIRTGHGKALMDELRHAIGAMRIDEMQSEMKAMALTHERSRQSLRNLALWAPVTWLAMGVLALVYVRRPRRADEIVSSSFLGGSQTTTLTRHLFAASVVIAAFGAHRWLEEITGALPPYITFFPAVLLIALTAGSSAGIVSTLFAAALADYFFIEPRASILVARPADLAGLGIFIISCSALCILSERLHHAQRTEYRRLRALLDGVKGFAIFMMDPRGIITTWNAAAENLDGHSAGEILGKDSTRFFAPEDIAAGLPARTLDIARQSGEWAGEGWRRRKDGSRFWASVTVTALRDHQGELMAFGQVTADSTRRKQAEDQLLAANERFAMGASAAGLGFWDLDVLTNTLRWDDRMFELYGLERCAGPQPYESWAANLHPEDRAASERALLEALDGGRTFDVEFRIVRPNGDIRHIKTSSGIKRDSAGRVIHMYGVDFDVTDRRRADEQFRMAIESAPTGMLMTDVDGTIVMVNARIETLFGYERAELIGRNLEMLVPRRFRPSHPGFLRDYFAAPQSRPMGAGRDLFGLRKNGSEVPIEIGLNPLSTSGGSFVLSSVIDITERKHSLQQLRSLNEDLEERVRLRTADLKEKEAMLQEIHHRVKNNLQVIASLINMQIRTLQDDASRTALQECRSRVQTMALIHEKLYGSSDYANVPFADYARDLTATVFSAAGVSSNVVNLVMEMEPLTMPVEQAIPCGLILNELINNAFKHAFTGASTGELRVGLRRLPGEHVELSVADNGPGIAEDFAPERSTSLGMRLVVTLVAQLRGRLEIVKSPGTTVRITFPVKA
jgi:PAS domain S-box-containing protein